MKYFSKIIKGYYSNQTPITPTQSYTINLNNQWQTSTISNPDSTQYDIYESFSNYNVNSGVAIMYITIKGYTEFKFYIRSYAEGNYDYVIVSQLDQTITGISSTEYNNTTLVKAHTRGNQKSGTTLSDYTEVVFSDIDGEEHTIIVLYRKDNSTHSDNDRGYLLINKSQESTLPDEEETSEIGVYIVDKDEIFWEVDDWTGGESASGVALVAGEHKFMIAKSDATDGTNTTLYWGKNLYEKDVAGITNTSGIGYIGEGKTYGTDFTTWSTGPVVDFNGAANTAAIIAGYTEHGVSMDARDMCTVLNTFNTSDSYNDWYVPACGQLALMYLAKTDINAALAKIGGTAFESYGYWSSSEYTVYRAWYVDFDNGFVHYYKKDLCGWVRFIRNLK